MPKAVLRRERHCNQAGDAYGPHNPTEITVNYACMSCGAKYSIPDARVEKAGSEGLRVRCSRCRAIMAVSSSMAASNKKSRSSKSDDVFSRTGGVSPNQPSQALVTGVMKNPFADVQAPVAASGGMQSVSREVTGIFMPMLASVEGDVVTEAKKQKSECFYAAIEGRARGPFSSKELLMLAEKGKVRAGTLLWKPGCSGWKPLKHVVDFDVSFLLDAVRTRKRREREAEILAQKKLGISAVKIERQTVRPVISAPNAPALPFDAMFDDVDAGNSNVPAAAEVSSPFLWQAQQSQTKQKQKPAVRTWVAAAAAAALVVVTVLMAAGVAP